MAGKTLIEKPPGTQDAVARESRVLGTQSIDLRGRTITTAIAVAARDALSDLPPGEEIQLLLDPFPALLPDLQALCRATGHELVDVPEQGEHRLVTLRKGVRRPSDQQVAVVVSTDGLEELLSPLGFALAAALEGARVAVYLQGPAVHVLKPGFQPRLHGLARPFSRFARSGLDRAGHVHPGEKLRQLQKLGGSLYACGPSLEHFHVDPSRLAFDHVIVCEYLTFMEVMRQSDVQLYA
jgi:TusA-related sulfurtransferase/predicted peroxiredoxin